MMKTILSVIALFLVLAFTVSAQEEVNEKLENASSYYDSGDLENARFELQEALSGVNKAIGEAILEIMPESFGGMEAVPEADNVMGTNNAFAGLTVNREYKGESRSASFGILSDSPMLATVSSLLNMSVLFAGDPNQKRIKIDGYKALMTREESSDGEISYSLQLPFGNSLMTFDCSGVDDEDEFVSLAEAIPVGEIVDIAQ
jgi:hypothetical protein